MSRHKPEPILDISPAWAAVHGREHTIMHRIEDWLGDCARSAFGDRAKVWTDTDILLDTRVAGIRLPSMMIGVEIRDEMVYAANDHTLGLLTKKLVAQLRAAKRRHDARRKQPAKAR